MSLLRQGKVWEKKLNVPSYLTFHTQAPSLWLAQGIHSVSWDGVSGGHDYHCYKLVVSICGPHTRNISITGTH